MLTLYTFNMGTWLIHKGSGIGVKDCLEVLKIYIYCNVFVTYIKPLPHIVAVQIQAIVVSWKQCLIVIAFYCFLPVQYLIIYLYSNKLHSADIFYKQHIKIFVLSKL